MTSMFSAPNLLALAGQVGEAPDEIQTALHRAWRAVCTSANTSVAVVDELTHLRAFDARLSERINEPDVIDLFAAYVDDVTTHSRDEWISMFRDVGFRGLYGDTMVPKAAPCTVIDTVPNEPVLLGRLADDYSVGLSWAGDPRFARSRAWNDGRINTMKLWCAVVPPEALLGVSWYGAGVMARGRPLWRTVDADGLGRVRLTLDCFGEWFVDPTMVDKVVVVDEFTREPVEVTCGSYRTFPTGRVVVAAGCKPDGCGAPDGCLAVEPVSPRPGEVEYVPRSWFRGGARS